MGKRHADPILEEIIGKLQSEFKLKKLFLFGSRAEGTATPDSDYDVLAVVSSSSDSRFNREVNARVALKDLPIAIDVFVYTEKEFAEAVQEPGSVADTAAAYGLELPLE